MNEAMTIDELMAKLEKFKAVHGGDVPIFINEPDRHYPDLALLDAWLSHTGQRHMVQLIAHYKDHREELKQYGQATSK